MVFRVPLTALRGDRMKILDVVLVLVIAAAVGLAVWRVVKNRRQGKSACGCDCSSCACGCDRRKQQEER